MIESSLGKAKSQLEWLKRQETKCALGSLWGLVCLAGYVPLDLLVQIVQYDCLKASCPRGFELINRCIS